VAAVLVPAPAPVLVALVPARGAVAK